MSSTRPSSMRYGPQSSQHGMAREPAHIQQPGPQMPGTGVPQKWQIEQGALQINFLAKILCDEMAKHNDMLQSYYNFLLYEKKQSQHLEGVVHDLQSKVQDAEIRRVATEERMRALQGDYQRLASFYNQSSSAVSDTPISGYQSASFSPTQSIRDIQPGSKRKADYPSVVCPMPKRTQGVSGTSLATPITLAPLKVENVYHG
ncbi:MAG: hypothetical protein M1839_005513 [Geoglossum umbratile]|nr:MAG: hypothetical protein M1839_005513 [Geoglossum umbratile]